MHLQLLDKYIKHIRYYLNIFISLCRCALSWLGYVMSPKTHVLKFGPQLLDQTIERQWSQVDSNKRPLEKQPPEPFSHLMTQCVATIQNKVVEPAPWIETSETMTKFFIFLINRSAQYSVTVVTDRYTYSQMCMLHLLCIYILVNFYLKYAPLNIQFKINTIV